MQSEKEWNVPHEMIPRFNFSFITIWQLVVELYSLRLAVSKVDHEFKGNGFKVGLNHH